MDVVENRSSFPSFLSKAALAAAFLVAAALPARLHALDLSIDTLSVSWTPGGSGCQGQTTLTWDSVDPSTTDAIVSYIVIATNVYSTSTNSVVTNGATIGGTTGTTLTFCHRGVRTYIVRAQDSMAGAGDFSPLAQSHFIHNTLAPQAQDIARFDAGGGQDGAGQQWTFNYKLQDDAYVTIAVYPPGAAFTKDASGFVASVSSAPTKVILDNTPRSFQMVGDSFLNTDIWDLRNSSGAVVTKGLYSVLFTARSKFDATTVLDTVVRTLPVDSIKVTNISATSITDAAPTSSVSFTVNADCEVKVIVCRPGTNFTVATSAGTLSYLAASTYTYDVGDNLPLNPSTGLVDGAQLLKVLNFFVDSGDHVFTWNGGDDEGGVLSSSLYPYTVSAQDAFGNYAVNLTGNHYSTFGTIPINRAGTQPPAIALSSIYPSAGEVLQSRLNVVYAVLGQGRPDVTVDGQRSQLVLTGPDGRTISGSKQWNSADRRMALFLDEPATRPGVYTLDVTAWGRDGNNQWVSQPYSTSFTLMVPQSFGETYVSPNPIKGVNSATFSIFMKAAADARFRIFNLLGEELVDKSLPLGAGLQSIVWDLKNDSGAALESGLYIYRLEANGEEVTKKFVLVQ